MIGGTLAVGGKEEVISILRRKIKEYTKMCRPVFMYSMIQKILGIPNIISTVREMYRFGAE